ncbi:MAG: MgtC/SapB family protein [Halobacteriota archaeon]|uniref:MgtC/SapB family protein n=1 Tax=Natronomonas sp. TaxID=2184060 RepID=UPI0039761EB9
MVEIVDSLFLRFLVAFGIGALIGLEREQAESGGMFAGSRTFPLFALIGAIVQAFFPGLLAATLLVIAIPLTVAYVAKVLTEGDIGLTTLVAAVLTVLLGAITVSSERGTLVAIIVGGVVTVLLSAKPTIHRIVNRIDERERRASLKFILVVVVVLPLLPDREIDVLYGLNPRFIWLMVGFVTGLSFVAYILSRIVGAKRGIALTGILGGFVSSTATTVSMSERTRENPDIYRIGTFSIVVASIVMFPRALIEVAVVNPTLLPQLLVPLGAMTGIGVLISGVVYWDSQAEPETEADLKNPFRLRPALFFGAVFAVVLLVSQSAHSVFGVSGIYATAFLSGLADVDAITLTLSALEAEGEISASTATTGIVIGAIANTLTKAGLAWLLGTAALGRRVTVALGAVSALGILVVVVL